MCMVVVLFGRAHTHATRRPRPRPDIHREPQIGFNEIRYKPFTNSYTHYVQLFHLNKRLEWRLIKIKEEKTETDGAGQDLVGKEKTWKKYIEATKNIEKNQKNPLMHLFKAYFDSNGPWSEPYGCLGLCSVV